MSTGRTSEILEPSSCQVSVLHVDIEEVSEQPSLDQRWYMFQKMGPAPSARSGHAMASMGTRVFVLGGLGGESLNPQKPEDHSVVHVLDTSAHLLLP